MTLVAADLMTSEGVSMISVGRKMTTTAVRISLVLSLLMVAVPVLSQESPAPPDFFLLSESSVMHSDSADWADAVAMAARAHAKHPEGNVWAAYRKLTGGPEETVRFFFPLNRMGDLDEWRSNHQILTEAMGKDRARIVLEDLELASENDEKVLSYSRKMSRPWPNFKATKYAWIEEVRVADGKMVEYAALVQRVIRAFAEHDSQGYWVIYGNAIGGDSSTLIWMYGFEQFAEIDAWESRLEALAKAMPEGEAARLVAAMEAISESTTSIWQMEPSLSQFAGE
jgi:hypothetical protein